MAAAKPKKLVYLDHLRCGAPKRFLVTCLPHDFRTCLPRNDIFWVVYPPIFELVYLATAPLFWCLRQVPKELVYLGTAPLLGCLRQVPKELVYLATALLFWCLRQDRQIDR